MIGIMETKVCTKCNVEYPATAEYFHRSKSGKYGLTARCKKCISEYYYKYNAQHSQKRHQQSREWNQRNQARIREQHRQRKYGLSDKQYNQMAMEQRGLCVICGLPEMRKRADRTMGLSVDHNHKTNKIRGLLCGNCNSGLGHFNVDNQSIELLCSAISYIKNTDGVWV